MLGGGRREHLLCPDDDNGVPEVFDLVYMGCNYQVRHFEGGLKKTAIGRTFYGILINTATDRPTLNAGAGLSVTSATTTVKQPQQQHLTVDT